ncbi:MAG: hypothetical protein IPO21_03875 [Bacteroidales bacterium]|nr:hypothetical protein [Bacteroidales bacterium]
MPNIFKKLKDGTYIQVSFFYSGDTYLFEFPHIYSFDYNWHFKAMPATELGTECHSPKRIDSLGVFELDNTNGSEWMTFLTEETGYYTVSIGDTTNPNVKLIKWDYCIFDEYKNYDTITSRKFETYQEKGSWIKLEFTGGASGEKYNAKLSFEAERQGDTCENPLIILEDSNYVQIKDDSYYQFTPTESNDYLISLNSSLDNTIIYIYKECNGTQIYSGASSNISAARCTLFKDTTYLIEIYGLTRQSFCIKKYIPQKGETCKDAVEIKNTGKHHIDHPVSDVWLMFVTPSAGIFYISTIDSTMSFKYIQVYKNNCDSLIAERRNNGGAILSYVEFFVEKGDTLLIKSNYVSFYHDAYSIILDYKEIIQIGTSCERPLPIAEIPASITTEKFY